MNTSKLRAAVAAALVIMGAAPALSAPAGAAAAQPIAGATVSPTSVEAGSAGQTLTVTYRVSEAAFRGYAGSQIPAGWTRPQSTSPTGPGYVEAVPGTCTKVSLVYVSNSATGPWTVAIDANCKGSQNFALRYRAVTAPTTAGPNTFPSGSMLNSSSTIQPVSPQPVVTVRPGPAVSLAVEGYPSPATAGTPGTATVAGLDRFGNRNAPLSGDVAITTTDTRAAVPPPAPLVDGSRRVDITFRTAGTQAINARSAATPTITGTQSGITVQPGPLTRIELSPATATVPAGVEQAYTAEGFDAYDNSRGPVSPTLTIAPTGTCTATACSDSAAGAHQVTGAVGSVRDTADLNVDAGQPTKFEFSGLPATSAAGQSFTAGVRAVDRFGNTASNYTGPVTFTSTDHQAGLPQPSSLTAGTGSFAFTLRTAGPQALTVSDVNMPGLTSTSAPVDVTPGPADHIVLDSATASVKAGESVSYTARAADAYGNDRGAVTPTLAISPDGSCAGMTCTTASGGTKTVTASGDGLRGTAVIDAAAEVVTVLPETLPPAALSEPYHATFTAEGALGATAFSVSGGQLPPGLTLARTGDLSGTPTAVGTFPFTVRATDANNVSGERAYAFVVRDVFTASPSPADFGSVAVTNSAERTITITNNGSRTVFFNGVGVDDDWNFPSFAGCFATTLAPGASCTQTPRFAPRTEGPHNGTLSLSWNDTADTSVTGTIRVPLTGVGTPRFTASPSPADFGSVAVTKTSERTITITNNGGAPVFFNGVGVDDDWNFPSFSGCFATTLAPGASCTQTPRFAPRTEGVHHGTLTLNWNDPANSASSGSITVPLIGLATPQFSASPAPADFGSVAVTQTAERTITITNNGSKAVFFNGVGVDDDWNFPSFSGCFGTTLEPGATCTQTPRFAPRTEGFHSGTLTLNWNDPANTSSTGTITVPLTGLATPQLSASPSPADFGSVPVTNTAERTITVTNKGSKAVFFNGVGVDDEWNFPSFSGCFGTTLEPGATCTQTPRFAPRTEGPHNGTLTLNWNDPANTSTSGSVRVSLRGYGLAELRATPSPADFGTAPVSGSNERTITVTNRGTRSLFFNGVGVDDEWNFPSFSGCFGTTLAPGATCTQTPRFSPRTEGAHNGTLTLNWNDAQDTSRTGTLTVRMTGKATPQITITPNPADFGDVALNTTREQAFTVTNNGTRSVFFNGVGVNDEWNFASFSGCFATTLAAGQSCTQTPRFAPRTEGPHNGTLTLSWYDAQDNSRTGVTTAAMRGRGIGELAPSPGYADFGSVVVTNTAERTITITNNGTRSVFFNGVGVDDDWNFPSFSGCFGTTLAPGATCTQTPRFAPRTEGPHNGTLTLNWNDSADTSRTGSIRVALAGVGTPALTASPSPADFGDVSVSQTSSRTITVTNNGTRSVFFNGVGVNDDWNFPSFSGCFGTTLAPGATCTQTPRFAPRTEGAHNGTLTLNWNDAADTSRTGSVTVPMTGNGV
jgi:hypothetical protein